MSCSHWYCASFCECEMLVLLGGMTTVRDSTTLLCSGWSECRRRFDPGRLASAKLKEPVPRAPERERLDEERPMV